jgi:hypothetical protein
MMKTVNQTHDISLKLIAIENTVLNVEKHWVGFILPAAVVGVAG